MNEAERISRGLAKAHRQHQGTRQSREHWKQRALKAEQALREIRNADPSRAWDIARDALPKEKVDG